MIRVERLGRDDWEVLRDVRAVALADSPHAFASTLERELEYDEGAWRAFLGAGTWWVARDGDGVVGVVALLREERRPGERHLVSMWVARQARGGGAAGALLDAALTCAREEDAEVVSLWVTDGNPRARRFYERAGFSTTGERQPLPSAPQVGEEKLALPLARRCCVGC